MNGKRVAIGAGIIVLTAGLVVACSDENACAKGAPAPARPAAPAKPNMVKPAAPKPAAPKVAKPPKTKSVPDGHGGTTIVVVHDDEDCDDD